ncbi:xanthine dehydrogenase molybdopterin binding subunit [Pseudomonadota bacterium]|nr:xanthine dehydrogenase molybdopterin binding subunit [Alphaproteobacteria bacterium]MDC1356590.1 xanthine dehydrogenase molybdopterin binding subunit [Pseudomonadota bacterium]
MMNKVAFHDSSIRHTTGQAIYIDDIPDQENLLHGGLVLSKCAFGKIKKINYSKLSNLPFYTKIIMAKDIPGENEIGPIKNGEPILAEDIITYYGQPVAIILANTHQEAIYAANLVEVEIEFIDDPILTLDEAYSKKSFLDDPIILEKGSVENEMDRSKFKVSDSFEIGGQDHFYLETHVALTFPGENNEYTVWSSTQHPTEVQHGVGKVLKVPSAKIDSKVRRLGGGFGGKESQATIFAAMSALCAFVTQQPVKIRLNRHDDMTASGKRHNFKIYFTVGFSSKGKINALDLKLLSNGGNVLDLSGPVMTRALTHLDNCYFIKSIKAIGYICKTNTVSNTAFRGFGGPQGMLAIENIIYSVAQFLKKPLDEIRHVNYYSKSNGLTTPYGQVVTKPRIDRVIKEIYEFSDYHKRLQTIKKFNLDQTRNKLPFRKGLALMPAKFGISFNKPSFNQAGALVHIYSDGSVRLNHGGTEMGQGLFVKVAQVVAECFKIPLDQIHITSTNTAEVPNTSATAASSGSDLNGMAAWDAASKIKNRMINHASQLFQKHKSEIIFENGRILAGNKSLSFSELTFSCWENRISLSSTGFYKTPKIHWDQGKLKGHPYFYFTWGAAVSEALIDINTGESRILQADIIQDCGNSLNENIDIGQIEGGFIQGLGWLTCEELHFSQDGKLLTTGPSTYKLPGSRDAPPKFKVKLLENADNDEKTIFRSKAVGEPPILLAISHLLALKDAIKAANPLSRPELLNSPATPSEILKVIRA